MDILTRLTQLFRSKPVHLIEGARCATFSPPFLKKTGETVTVKRGDCYSFDGAKLGLMVKYRGCCKSPLDTVFNRPAAEKLNKFCIKI